MAASGNLRLVGTYPQIGPSPTGQYFPVNACDLRKCNVISQLVFTTSGTIPRARRACACRKCTHFCSISVNKPAERRKRALSRSRICCVNTTKGGAFHCRRVRHEIARAAAAEAINIPHHAGRIVVSELRLLSRGDYLVRAALNSFGGSRRASLFIYATEQVSTFPKICILLKLAGCPLSSVVLLFFLRMPHNSLAPFLPLFRYISNRVCVLSECQLVLTDLRAHVVPALIHEKRFPFYQQWSLY